MSPEKWDQFILPSVVYDCSFTNSSWAFNCRNPVKGLTKQRPGIILKFLVPSPEKGVSFT